MFVAGFDCVAFVIHFFTPSKGYCDFDFSVFEVDFERDDGKSFLFRLTFEVLDLAFMHQKFACFPSFVLESGAEFVRLDVEAKKEEFAVFDLTICVSEVGATEVEALDF